MKRDFYEVYTVIDGMPAMHYGGFDKDEAIRVYGIVLRNMGTPRIAIEGRQLNISEADRFCRTNNNLMFGGRK